MSTIKVNTIEEATSGGATYYTSKAWVNFNGTGTVAIRADGNVSSITDNSVGSYNVNFTSVMASNNYATSLGHMTTSDGSTVSHLGTDSTVYTSSLYRIDVVKPGVALYDAYILSGISTL